MSEPAQRPQPASRPYPIQYVAQWNLRDGTQVTIRPTRPDDEQSALDFYERLSDRSAHLRYFGSKQKGEGEHEYLHRICCVDYDHEIVLVAMHGETVPNREKMIAGARLIKLQEMNEAEFSVIVSDEYQHQGLGTELCRRLLGIARVEGIHRVICLILPENTGMRTICERLGFHLAYDMEDNLVHGKITFDGSE